MPAFLYNNKPEITQNAGQGFSNPLCRMWIVITVDRHNRANNFCTQPNKFTTASQFLRIVPHALKHFVAAFHHIVVSG